MFIATYTAAIFSVFAFALGGLLFYEKGRDRLSFLLASVIVSAGMWAFSNSRADVALSDWSALFWCGMAVISILTLTSFFLTFVDRFIEPEQKLSWKRVALYFAPTAIITPFAFTSYTTSSVTLLYTAPSQEGLGIVYLPVALFYYGSTVVAYYRLFQHARHAEARTRKQVLFIILGTFITALGSAIFDIILPLMGELRFYSVGPVSTIALIALTSYAILYHHLLDIRIIVQRSAIYTTVLAIIITFYLFTVSVIGLVFGSLAGSQELIAGIITTIFGVFTAPTIERLFRRITDDYFFKDSCDYAKALEELYEILNNDTEAGSVIDTVQERLAQILKVHSVRFMIPASGGTLIPALYTNEETATAEPRMIWGAIEEDMSTARHHEVTPIVLEDRTLGTIEVSGKLSGEKLSGEDRRFLKTFSSHAAVVLEKARLYDEIKRYTEELEERVAERTADIREAQEVQKQMMVDISHNLQTPLTILKIQLELMRPQIDPERYAIFERSIDAISKFIYDLLNLTHLEMQREKLLKKPIVLSDIVEDVAHYFMPIAEEKEIAITTSIEPDMTILGDKAKIREVAMNIISNAFKYTPPHEGNSIHIMLRAENAHIRFSCTDTGIGMRPEILPHIFKRLYRSPDFAGSAAIGGSGLGLAIVKQIVNKHDGTISVESEPDKGSTFTISFKKYELHRATN